MTTTIPFKDLVAADAINARAKAAKDGLDELAASIAAKGLIQPLAVRPADNGRYEIIDGRRRYQAMQRLVKQRTWRKDAPVPVLIRNEDDMEALETSLVANTVRLPMHPVDQHEVFARLADSGLAAADIAARFALAEKTVRQHLALGRLAPEIRDAWRKGRLDAKCAQAFTIEPRHELQVAAWERLKRGGSVQDWAVRRELTGDRPRADRLPPQILEAYHAAGGTVSESLFEEERYIDDGALLAKVRTDAVEAERQRLLADGWSWVAIDDDLPTSWKWQWEKVHEHVEPDYTVEEEADAAELDAQISADKLSPAAADAVEAKLNALERRAMERAYTPEERARSGVVIEVWDDEISTALGIIRPEGATVDLRSPPDGAEPRDSSSDGKFGNWDEDDVYDPTADYDEPARNETPASEAEDNGPRISNALLESLTTTLTLAAQRAIAADPSLALRATVAALMIGAWGMPVRIRLDGYDTGALKAGARDTFRDRLSVLADLSDAELMARFAALLPEALDLRAHNTAADRSADEALRDALPADVYLAAARELFNAADYFNRAPKQIAEAALREMGHSPMSGAKKSDLAPWATSAAKEAGWLPPELRHPDYQLLTEMEDAS